MSSTNGNEEIDMVMDSAPSTFVRQAFYSDLYKSLKNKPRSAQPMSKRLERKLEAAIAKLIAEQKARTPAENS